MTHRPTLAPAANGLHKVPLDLVDFERQERTQSGLDPASLAELASSISRDGLMQPPLLRWKGSRLVVVAGERRVRACRMAGLASVHAIVGEADDKRARLLRLAENHQRENLSTAETAAAVKELADEGMTLAEIAAAFSKSKAWASKHLGISREDFSQRARFMLEHGACEDLEKLHILSQLELATDMPATRLAELARSINEISRKELRLILKKAKAGEIEEEAEEDETDGPKVSDKPPFAKLGKLQLDEASAAAILEALDSYYDCGDDGYRLVVDHVRKFVADVWPAPAVHSEPELEDAVHQAIAELAAPVAPKNAPYKYRDARTGNTWSGRGLMPAWLKNALADGAKLDDFLL